MNERGRGGMYPLLPSCLELVLARERENRRRKSRTLVEIDRAKEEAGGARRGVAPRKKGEKESPLSTHGHSSKRWLPDRSSGT